MSLKLSEEQIKNIQDAVLDDSTKIIRYLEEQQHKQKKYNYFVLSVTILGTISSLIAAITGVIVLFFN